MEGHKQGDQTWPAGSVMQSTESSGGTSIQKNDYGETVGPPSTTNVSKPDRHVSIRRHQEADLGMVDASSHEGADGIQTQPNLNGEKMELFSICCTLSGANPGGRCSKECSKNTTQNKNTQESGDVMSPSPSGPGNNAFLKPLELARSRGSFASGSSPILIARAVSVRQVQDEGKSQKAGGGETTKRETEWDRVKRNLYQPPRILHDWMLDSPEAEVKAGWTELFYDLVFVAAIINLADVMVTDVSLNKMLEFFLYFTSFWWTWQTANYYYSRFVFDDYLHEYLVFFHTTGVLGMAIHTETSFELYRGFLVSYAISRVAIVALYTSVCMHIPKARRSCYLVIAANGVSTVGMLVGATLPKNAAVIVWIVSLLLEIGLCMVPVKKEHRIEPNFAYATERFGLFIMVALGETVVSIVLPPQDHSWQYYAVAFFGFWTIFNLEINFFDCQPSGDGSLILSSRLRIRLVLVLHYFVSATLVAIATGIKVCMYKPRDILPMGERWLLCGSLAGSLWLMQAGRLVNQEQWGDGWLFLAKFKDTWWLVCFFLRNTLPVVALLMALAENLESADAVLGLWALTFTYAAVDMWAHHRWEPASPSPDTLSIVSREHTNIPTPPATIPGLQEFMLWNAEEVSRWLADSVKVDDVSQQLSKQMGVTGSHLLDAPAAELIRVFGPQDGVAVIMALAAIVENSSLLNKRISNTRNLTRQNSKLVGGGRQGGTTQHGNTRV